jgi:hypothetical protein
MLPTGKSGCILPERTTKERISKSIDVREVRRVKMIKGRTMNRSVLMMVMGIFFSMFMVILFEQSESCFTSHCVRRILFIP